MESSSVSHSKNSSQGDIAPSNRMRFNPDHARQVAADDAVRQKERAEENRAVQRRKSMADINRDVMDFAYRKLYAEEDRIREKQNTDAGVDKMIRTVIRKENSETQGPDRGEETNQSDYMREKVNSAYNTSRYNESSPRDEELRPSPSERQQKRAIENYQQSTRNPVDQTVELVV